MKLFSNNYKKMYFIGISVVTVFSLMGIGYCAWNSSVNFNHHLKTGQLTLENDNNESSIVVELTDTYNDFTVPFSIKNLSTIPVREESISFKLCDEDITKSCDVVFSNSTNDNIKGELVLDLVKINETIMKNEIQDYSLITEPINIKRPLKVKMEFQQANLDKNGWSDSITFDIDIVKTIMPIKVEVFPTIALEAVPESETVEVPEIVSEEESQAVPEVVPEEQSEVIPEVVPEEESEVVTEVAPKEESQAVPEVAPEEESQAVPEVAPEEESQAVPEVAPEEESQAVPEIAPEEESQAVPEVAP